MSSCFFCKRASAARKLWNRRGLTCMMAGECVCLCCVLQMVRVPIVAERHFSARRWFRMRGSCLLHHRASWIRLLIVSCIDFSFVENSVFVEGTRAVIQGAFCLVERCTKRGYEMKQRECVPSLLHAPFGRVQIPHDPQQISRRGNETTFRLGIFEVGFKQMIPFRADGRPCPPEH